MEDFGHFMSLCGLTNLNFCQEPLKNSFQLNCMLHKCLILRYIFVFSLHAKLKLKFRVFIIQNANSHHICNIRNLQLMGGRGR